MPDMNALMKEARSIIDELEKIGEVDKRLRSRKSEIELELMRFSESSGLETFSSDDLTCTISEKTRACYDPAKWNEVVKWAVDTGNEIVIQRRLSDARLVEIATSGTALPAGIRLEPYSAVAFRRK